MNKLISQYATVNVRLMASWLLIALFAVGATACSSAPKKDDTVKVVEKKGPTRAEKLGLKDGALAAFEKASKELAKEKPVYNVALDSLKEAVELSPNFAEAQYNLGLLYLQLDKPGDAVLAFEKARELDPEYQEYAVALGRAYAGIERYDDAHGLFEDVIAREPNNLTAKNNLAVLELMRGETDKAISILQEILREDQKNVAALNTMGRVYRKARNLSLAKYVYEEKALKVAPDDADLHNNLGLVYLDLKRVPNAVNHFQKATEADPNHQEAHINLGTIVLDYLDYDRAEGEFDEAVRIAPGNCDARLGRAASKFAVSKFEDSEAEYTYYVDQCDPKHISAHERLASIYQSHLQDTEKAIKEYRTLISITDNEKKRKNYEAMATFLENQAKQAAQKPPEEPAAEQPQDESEESGENTEDTEEVDET